MKVCQYCGAVNDDDKLTCEKCGGTLGLIPDGQAQTSQSVQPQSQQAAFMPTAQEAGNKKTVIIVAVTAAVTAIIIILFLFVFKKDNTDSSSSAPEQITTTTAQTTTTTTAQTTTTTQTTTEQTTTNEQTTTTAQTTTKQTTTSGELSDAEKQAALEKANSIAKYAYSALGNDIDYRLSNAQTVSSINMNAPLPVETLKISDNPVLRELYKTLEKGGYAHGYIYISYNADYEFYNNVKYCFVQWSDDKNFYIWSEKTGKAIIGQFPNAPKTVDQCPQFGKNSADGTTTAQSQATTSTTTNVSVAKDKYAAAIIGTWLYSINYSTMTFDKRYRFSMYDAGAEFTGTYELNGDILEITYTMRGKTYTDTYRVKSLSDEKMILADVRNKIYEFNRLR